MPQATLNIDPAFSSAPVRPRTFGSFVEHLGRCVYTGIYEPGHPLADEHGFRSDVLEATRDLGVTMVRYPGGNFVSGYRWEDGVGPAEQRPRRLDLAWHSTEPNQVGVDEFMAWAKLAGVEPMMALNLGTRGVQEALDLLEYCNVPQGTYWSNARRANGAEEPYRVKLWCLGNEMDGPWQIGGKTAREYGRLASQTAKAMRLIDPNLQLVVCGSSSSAMPTFGKWEKTVLDETYDDVDFISAHAYYWEKDGDLESFLGSAVDMDRFIAAVVATCDHVRAVRKADKRLMISFDEWNVWYQDRAESRPPTGDDWPVAPVLLEDRYNVADAVVVGNLLISLLRHSDRVQAACLAQLVNVIAPIMTEPGGGLWRQTTFHPFALTARHAKGHVLELPVNCPTTATTRFGDIPVIDAAATHDADTGDLTVFMVNRSAAEMIDLRLDLRAVRRSRLVEAVLLSSPDHTRRANADDPATVSPKPLDAQLSGGAAAVALPPISWAMVRLSAS
ncbi:MAG: alpha-N-arabinofuranosidase [Propionibacteriaceae bacterium]|nr:alpha-N-arabinofuranosidase [Propionibacteriaceae bacterium]